VGRRRRGDRRPGQVHGRKVGRRGHGGLHAAGHGRGDRVGDAQRRTLVGPDLDDAQVGELARRDHHLVHPLVRHQAGSANDERVASRWQVEEEPPRGVALRLALPPDDGDRGAGHAVQAALVAEKAGDAPLPLGNGGGRRREDERHDQREDERPREDEGNRDVAAKRHGPRILYRGGSGRSAQPRPGRVSRAGSSRRRASRAGIPAISPASSAMDLPLRSDSFTIPAAASYPIRGASAVARLTVRSA
jgi:hypothetical protein